MIQNKNIVYILFQKGCPFPAFFCLFLPFFFFLKKKAMKKDETKSSTKKRKVFLVSLQKRYLKVGLRHKGGPRHNKKCKAVVVALPSKNAKLLSGPTGRKSFKKCEPFFVSKNFFLSTIFCFKKFFFVNHFFQSLPGIPSRRDR